MCNLLLDEKNDTPLMLISDSELSIKTGDRGRLPVLDLCQTVKNTPTNISKTSYLTHDVPLWLIHTQNKLI